MSKLFYNLGRTVGHAAIPVIRKSKSAWKNVAGTEEEAMEAETEFGRSFAAELRLKIGVAARPEETEHLREVLRRLSCCVRNKLRTFSVDLLLREQTAAIALPGGFIFISTDLLEFCQRDPNELAFVLGHEMAHIIRGHAQDRMSERIGKEGLSNLVSRGLLNPLLREGSLEWLEQAYPPDAEAEADEFGVRVMRAASFDPAGAQNFVRRVESRRAEGSGLGTYLSSHPPLEERLKSIRLAGI